jgi:hypothetical protein
MRRLFVPVLLSTIAIALLAGPTARAVDRLTEVLIANDASRPVPVSGQVQVTSSDGRSALPVTGQVQISGTPMVQTDPAAPITVGNLKDYSSLITTQYCSADSTIFNPNLGLSTRFAGLVPTGKRLILDYVSVYGTGPSGERMSSWVRAWDPLSAIKDEKHGRVFIPLTFQGTFDPLDISPFTVMDGTTALQSFADEGWYIDVVFPTSAKPSSGVWTCQATLMAHVVDKIAALQQQ